MTWDEVPETWPTRCIDCGERVESGHTIGGPYICVSCAVAEAQRKLPCMKCRKPIEKGPLCPNCESVVAATRHRVLVEAAPMWPTLLRALKERLEERHGRDPDAA